MKCLAQSACSIMFVGRGRGREEKEGGRGKGEKMTQTLYAHMNKRYN
jgi:hypothetical protein